MAWPGWNQKILMKVTVFDGYSAPETGYNGCLFAYGQTGSGKTFTMQGAFCFVFAQRRRPLINHGVNIPSGKLT